ncbi:MAG TPA: ABC transporter permease subunit [Tepidisphaeraceae bacterium]|jgi:ABC-type transport system involved in multi-copper enzyme maturation permease subunit
MLGIGDYLWRLIPANPILLRVVETGGKRTRDLFVRCGYLGLLILVVFVAIVSSGGSNAGTSLSELAKTSARLFQQLSYLQLGLVALLAPVFTAGAITQEKDSQTYDILLSTPLTNGQILLGSLLSRIFFVIALLISGIPIFSITQIFGGVAIRSIVLSFAIAASTTFVTGALAMAIATFKVGTRRTIFSFYLFIMIYLIGGILLDQAAFMHPVIGAERDGSGQVVLNEMGNPKVIRAKTSYLTGINPFLALRVLFHEQQYTPPDVGALPPEMKGWPTRWYISSPETFYPWLMMTLSVVMVLPSMLLLRRLAQSTTNLRTLLLRSLKLTKGDRTRKPRVVWANPIAWREAKTKASAARATVLRFTFILGGLAVAIAVLALFSREKLEGKYITASSYNATHGTLTIFDGDSATTYRVRPNTTKISMMRPGGPADVETDALYGRMTVDSVQVARPGSLELTALTLRDVPRRIAESEARSFLLGAIVVEFAVILLIVTNAAASTVTREKEDGTLDILLSTPITSRYYIWGKLRGLVSYVMPLVAVPVASALLFIIYDLWRVGAWGGGPNFRWLVFPESVLIMPPMLIIATAFASILGMSMSLRCRTTVRAVMSSVGIVLGACGALGWCGYTILSGHRTGEVALAVGAFSPFTVLTVLIDPASYGGDAFLPGAGDPTTGRLMILIFSWIATAGYALGVWAMYKSMVKNFDMTIRKQSR